MSHPKIELILASKKIKQFGFYGVEALKRSNPNFYPFVRLAQFQIERYRTHPDGP